VLTSLLREKEADLANYAIKTADRNHSYQPFLFNFEKPDTSGIS